MSEFPRRTLFAAGAAVLASTALEGCSNKPLSPTPEVSPDPRFDQGELVKRVNGQAEQTGFDVVTTAFGSVKEYLPDERMVFTYEKGTETSEAIVKPFQLASHPDRSVSLLLAMPKKQAASVACTLETSTGRLQATFGLNADFVRRITEGGAYTWLNFLGTIAQAQREPAKNGGEVTETNPAHLESVKSESSSMSALITVLSDTSSVEVIGGGATSGTVESSNKEEFLVYAPKAVAINNSVAAEIFS